jgi:hypothetical protein
MVRCIAVVLLVASAQGQSYAPYTSDAATLHLWHLDWSVTDAGTSPVTLGALGGGATLGNTSAVGLGTALSTVDGGAYVSPGTGTDAYLAMSPLVNGAGDNVTTTFCNASTGAFTFEAVVRFEFDPLTSLNVRNSSMQILSGEQDGTGGGVRSFQFRIDPVGYTPGQDGFTTALSAPAIEFINLRNGAPEYKIVQLPTTGANAVTQGAWYHVAITYSGAEGRNGNLRFYWTKLDGSQSQAALLGSKNLPSDLSTGAVDLAIGNIGRDPSQNNFVGLIDEVRISSAARLPTELLPAFYDGGGHVSSAPTGLSATAASRSEISLSWAPIAGAIGYNVKRATVSNGPYTAIAISDNVLTENYVDSGLTNSTTYYYVVSAVNSAGESANSSQVAATPQPVFFTEKFDGGTDSNDTAFTTYTFAPSSNENGYTVSRARTSVFPTDTSTSAGGTALTMSDETSVAVTLTGSVTVPFYGTNYSTFYVGSNGYLTFGSADLGYSGLTADHFAKPRISALFRDLQPSTGMVTWRQLSDRVAVTWQNVPQYSSSDLNNFQIEIFTGGTIRITILAIAATDGVVGLSRGTGTPSGFVENNFSAFPVTFVDTDGDGLPDWWESQYFSNLNQKGSGDPDGDGIDNFHEYQSGTNPAVANATGADSDGDGLSDTWEQQYFGSLTQNAAGDYDRDGISNGAEYAAGTDPTNPNSVPGDVDGDGLPDAWEQANLNGLTYGAYDDPDGDGYNNLAEMVASTNPLDATSHPAWVSPRMIYLRDSVVAADACLMPSTAPYGRAINGQCFQTILVTYDGYQYTAWYNTSGTTQTVWLARRTVNGQSVGDWEKFDTGSLFTNGKSGWDAHNIISIGICTADGTLHISWDHHDNTLRYRRSVVGLCTTNKAVWGSSAMLNAEQSKLSTADAANYDGDVTYPRFINAPDGTLYFQRRYGITNNGDQLFQKYVPATGAWTANTLFSSRSGTYTGLLATGYKTSSARNGYPNGFDFGPDGTIHHTFTYREQADSSNHDINYIYSPDAGVTWRNNAGTVIANTSTGASVNVNSPGIKMKVLDSRQLFINQQSQCVDNDGRVHVLGLHRRAESAYAWQSGDATFTVVDAAYYHYFRDPATGVWSQRRLPVTPYPVGSRPKIGFDAKGNVYAIYVSYASTATNVVPGYSGGKLVVASASKASQYTDWEVVQVVNGDFDGDPLIDHSRLLADGVLSVYIQENSTTTALVGTRLHVFDFSVPANVAPTMATIADQSVAYGTTLISIPVTVDDADNVISSLTLTGVSSNEALVPSANITFSGAGPARTATITPASASGTTAVTFTVNDGSATASRSFNLTVLNPAETWRQQNFSTTANAGNAADTADPDGDGLLNLLEYALGSNPKGESASAMPQVSAVGGKLTITFTRNTAAVDVTLSVLGADDLAGTWTELARSTGGSAFAVGGSGASVTESGSGATRTVQVADVYSTTDAMHPHRFLKVQALH